MPDPMQATPGQALVGPFHFFVLERFGLLAVSLDQRHLPFRILWCWDGLLGQAGDFKKVVNTHTQEKEGFQIVFVTRAFAKTNLDAKVVFDGPGMIAGVFFVKPQNSSASWSPPSYIQCTNIREQPVTIGKNPCKLPGILTLPVGRGPFPGVLLVQGSGPQDMDETVGAN
jgi:hypothetical protein